MTIPEHPARRHPLRDARRDAGREPLRVLIVEDSEDDALLLVRELKRGGYEPLHERVDTPEAMDEALSREPWDVVISDYYMPSFRAPDALTLLRRRGSDAPFVVVSGQVGEELAVEAMRAGAYDYIMKDNMTRLCATIGRGLEEVEVRRERERVEKALVESEERFRSLVRNASDIILILDIDGTIRYESPAVERVLGFTPEERIGTNAFDHPHPDDRRLVRDKFTELLEKPDDRISVEYRVRDKEGSWHHFEAIGTNLLGNPTIHGIVVNIRDITERKVAEERLKRSLDRLLALHEAGHILGSTLEPEEIGTRLLEIMRRISGFTTAVISSRDENGRLGVWRSIGLENLEPKIRYTSEVWGALEAAIEQGKTQVFALGPSGATGLCLALRVRERSLGVLEVYGPETLAEKDTVAMLESLASQAASALENARLYGELAERERRLQELVGKILVAQEEERRRVAYEVHDGLAQVAAAAHQHLQAFAQYHPPPSREGREDLDRVSRLVRRTVGEARRIIADLRPTALDDLGLEAAIRLQLEALRAEGWQISYKGDLDDERLPVPVETACFRIAQEALTNVVKHARTRRVSLTLEYLRSPHEVVRLSVRDYGVGFSPDAPAKASGPGERVGLSGMRERVALLGGSFRVASRPGAGTLIVADIPLWEAVGR